MYVYNSSYDIAYVCVCAIVRIFHLVNITHKYVLNVSCKRSLCCLYLQSKGETAQDNISARDAMFYPIYASVALFGLYIFFKFVPKEYVNIALSIFFFIVCVAGLARLAG